ncbi:MAG: hypothetical protein ACE5E6_03915 [Phycisphaerae bacterium]
MSPTQTVAHVNALRRSGRYRAIEPFLLDEQRPHIIALIQSVDRLLTANGVLQAAITDRLGPASAQPFDRASVGDIIGVFSMNLRVHDERIDGDTAVVTIEVGGRLPLDEVTLRRRDRRWVIETDPPRPAVTAELFRLADVLTDVARDVRTRSFTADELRRELAFRLAPIGHRLMARTSAPPDG